VFFSKMGSEQYVSDISVKRAGGGFLSTTKFIITGALRITGKGATMRLFLIIPGPWNYAPKIPKRSITVVLPGREKVNIPRL
jgi:hypothetical protein